MQRYENVEGGQSNKGTRKWGNEDNEYGNEEEAVACEAGGDKDETGKQRDNKKRKEEGERRYGTVTEIKSWRSKSKGDLKEVQ